MQTLLLILVPFFPALCAAVCWFAPAVREDKKRDAFVLCSLIVSFVLTCALCLTGDGRVTLFEMTETLPVILASDGLARLFAVLMSGMWLVSGAFSFGYMAHEGSQRRYYTFYLLTEAALLGLCFAGTLVTMYLFFEMMTLLSVAMVLHSLTKEAVAAGIKYLLYSIAGAMMGLMGVFYFTKNAIVPTFVPGGTLDLAVAGAEAPLMLAILFVTIVGFGTKAGMFPMHGWLPTAHPIAPAPASAVLSGVITKAGVICIIRFLYYVVGADLVRGTWVQTALIVLSLITVFMGSMMAFKTTGFKKRLAYSSVSQVSYVLFGLFMMNEIAFRGAMLHVYFHSVMKNLLFLCAGGVIFKTGLTDVRDLRGIGKRMPATLWCFTLAGVSLVGVPPLCGFFSKWQLAQGALASGVATFSWLGPVVLLVSALLTAGYLLPVSIDGFFVGHHYEGDLTSCELNWKMLLPLFVLTALLVVLGVCPALVEGPVAAVAASLM
ncbi:MAG: proton-conducting membrane transporter [Clostridia bacterium]|nr:proton-conducting membrane transporter [Clostridia bacterium]